MDADYTARCVHRGWNVDRPRVQYPRQHRGSAAVFICIYFNSLEQRLHSGIPETPLRTGQDPSCLGCVLSFYVPIAAVDRPNAILI